MRFDRLPTELPQRDVTDPAVFFNRRTFLKATAAIGFLGTPGACGQVPPAVTEGPDPRLVPPPARPLVVEPDLGELSRVEWVVLKIPAAELLELAPALVPLCWQRRWQSIEQ